jgi:hypothetical protein
VFLQGAQLRNETVDLRDAYLDDDGILG